MSKLVTYLPTRNELAGEFSQPSPPPIHSWSGALDFLKKRPTPISELADASRLREHAEKNGQHIVRVLGKHAAGVARALLLKERAYLPQRLYDPDSPLEDRGIYFQEYWPKLRAKWRGLVPHQQLFDPAQPLGRWRQMVQEAYRISLPLPSGEQTQNHNQRTHHPEKSQNPPEEILT